MVPPFALTLAYWLHMLATVLWIGGICSLSLLVVPAASKSLDAQAYASLLENLQKRMDPIVWISLALLAATGLVQMSANPNYHGFLVLNNRWAAAILVKHLMFLLMAGLSVYMSWGVLPKLRRLAIQRQHLPQDVFAAQAAVLANQELRLVRLNLILGVLVLALTAVARAS